MGAAGCIAAGAASDMLMSGTAVGSLGAADGMLMSGGPEALGMS